MADYIYVETTGVIVPDTADTLTDVQNEFKNAFISGIAPRVINWK